MYVGIFRKIENLSPKFMVGFLNYILVWKAANVILME